MECKPTKIANGVEPLDSIQHMIFTVRGVQVMIDNDLAKIYQVETKMFNRAVSRNVNRFPESFRFQLTDEEYENLRFQFGTSSAHGGRRYRPYVFTEQGVSMLSAVLRSETAINVSIQVIKAFVEMRRFIQHNANIFARLDSVERRQITFESETEKSFEKVFKALGSDNQPKQGIFYDGQVYDAYAFVSDLVRGAQKSLILVDNYVDDSVLTLLTKRNPEVSVTIYTKFISKQLTLDLKKHNQQYAKIEIKELSKSHDRFIILDRKTVYHFGASLKDLGRKWFAFSKMEMDASEILEKLEREEKN
jgi:phage regulator Rha-like protein